MSHGMEWNVDMKVESASRMIAKESEERTCDFRFEHAREEISMVIPKHNSANNFLTVY